jgi:hypothetical protein
MSQKEKKTPEFDKLVEVLPPSKLEKLGVAPISEAVKTQTRFETAQEVEAQTAFVRVADKTVQNARAKMGILDQFDEHGKLRKDPIVAEEETHRTNLTRLGKLRFDDAAFKNKDPYSVHDARFNAADEKQILRFAAQQTEGNPDLIVEMADMKKGFRVYEKEADEFGRIANGKLYPSREVVEFAEYPKIGVLETADTGIKKRGAK